MPRRRTHDEPGHAHELTFSCSHRRPFLKADRTRLWLVESIESARARLQFDLWAYVFMPEHVHLIVRPRVPTCTIPVLLRAIKEPVARRAVEFLAHQSPEWLSRLAVAHGPRIEHRFWLPGGGYDRNIVEPRTLHAMIEYVHANPVRRGLVQRPADFRWSSAAWYAEIPQTEDHPIIPDPIPPEWSSPSTSS
jgi:putative transposase